MAVAMATDRRPAVRAGTGVLSNLPYKLWQTAAQLPNLRGIPPTPAPLPGREGVLRLWRNKCTSMCVHRCADISYLSYHG